MKNFLLFAFLLFYSGLCYSQSVRNNELFAKGVELYQVGKYKEAIPYFEQVVRLDSIELGGIPRGGHSSVWLSSCWYKLGNTKKAKEIDNTGYETQPVDRRLTATIDSLLFLGMQTHDFAEGFKIFLRCIQMEHEIVPHPSTYRIVLLECASMALYGQNKTEEALLYANMAESECRQTVSPDNPQYVEVWKTKAQILFEAGRFDEALDELGKASNLLIGIKQTETEEFWGILDQAMRIAFLTGDNDGFVDCVPIILDLTQKLYGNQSEKYATELGDITLMAGEMQDSICIDVGQEYASVTESVYGHLSPQYQQACALLSKYSLTLMNYSLARNYFFQLFDVTEKMNPEQPEPAYLKNLAITSTYLYEDLDSAEYFLNLALKDIDKTGIPKDATITGEFLQGLILFLKGNYKEATPVLWNVLSSPENRALVDSVSFDFNKVLLAYSLCMSGDYTQGRIVGRQAIDKLRSYFMNPGTSGRARGLLKHLNSSISLFDNAHSNSLFTMPDSVKYAYAELRSELLRLKLEQLYQLEFDNEDWEFYLTLRDFGGTSNWTKDYLHTRKVVQLYTDIVLSKYGEQSWQYDMCLDALYQCYDNKDIERINLLKKQIAIEQQIYGKKDPIVISTLEKYYKLIDDQESLLKLKAQHKNKGSNAGTLAYSYWNNKDYNSALKIFKEDFNHQIKNDYDAHSLGKTISNILMCLIEIGQSDQVANECMSKMRMIEKRRPTLLRDVVTTLFATFYGLTDGEHDDLRLKCFEDMCNSFPDILGNDPELQACILTAPYHYSFYSIKNLEQTLLAYDHGISLVKTVNKRLCSELQFKKLQTEYYVKYRIHIPPQAGADIYRIGQEMQEILQAYSGSESSTEAYLATAIQLQGAWLQKNSAEVDRLARLITPLMNMELNSIFNNSEIVRVLNNNWYMDMAPIKIEDYDNMLMDVMAHVDLGEANAQACAAMMNKRVKQVKEHITSPYYSQSVQEEMENLIQEATYMAYRWHTDSLAAMAFDASIYCKGAMLRSRKLMEKQIESTGNETARRLLEEFKSTSLLLDRLADYNNKQYADSLMARKNVLENEIVEKSSMFGDYSKELAASWHDVRSHLQPDEAAIEFSQYRLNDNTYYCALVLKRQDNYPFLITLCNEKELMSAMNAYTDSRLYNIVWRPLEASLNGIKTIYFSPSGVIHQIAVEDALGEDGQRISNKYNLYRLSNTRALIGNKPSIDSNKALLVGGIQYELDPEEWEYIANSCGEAFDNTFASRDIVSFDEIKTRGALNYLSGTGVEVDNIAVQMKKVNVPTTCIKGAEASEDLFKASCRDNTIIHIATHGFYLSDDTDMPHQSAIGSEEDISMSRSGLLMAGSMSYLDNEQIPDNVDDGILTAREISRLDLTTASLVTLSACETALGDITGEGVFGLQRGFKKAGANSILMSLWKVDDEATCMLMTEFYRNWIGKGKSKHEALELAKEAVRNHPGWEDPKYWAAFILLDGLD